jgi:hypothetical protein
LHYTRIQFLLELWKHSILVYSVSEFTPGLEVWVCFQRFPYRHTIIVQSDLLIILIEPHIEPYIEPYMSSCHDWRGKTVAANRVVFGPRGSQEFSISKTRARLGTVAVVSPLQRHAPEPAAWRHFQCLAPCLARLQETCRDKSKAGERNHIHGFIAG